MARTIAAGFQVDILSESNSTSTHGDNLDDDTFSMKSSVARSYSYFILTIGLLGFYSLLIHRYLFAQQQLSLEKYGEEDAELRRCVDSVGGLWGPHESILHRPSLTKNNVSIDFRVLCTSFEKRIAWGSYKLRCNDLKSWANVCAPNVDITVGVSLEKIHQRWMKKSNRTKLNPDEIDIDDVFFNSTLFIKSLSRRNFSQFGKKFIDVVDEYNWKQENVPTDMHLIFQTGWQGPSLFPNHSFSVVEHWYNSYPFDMVNPGNPEVIPSITQKSSDHLSIATVWNTRRSHDPTEGGCPAVSVPGVKYSCLDKDFDITSWYLNVLKGEGHKCDMVRIKALQQLGPGMLYYNVFRKFDALVVLAKNHTMKLEYGNVQRAISQMRSGVPVLIEIRGKVFEDFMDQYNYSCAFRRYYDESPGEQVSTGRLMTFDEAVKKLKDPEVRKECQQQGLEIIKDYSPSKIGQKFLRTIGYDGDFVC